MKNEKMNLIEVSNYNKNEFIEIYDRSYVEDRNGFLNTFYSCYKTKELDFIWNYYFLITVENKNVGIAYLSYGLDRKVCNSYIYIKKGFRKKGIGKDVKRELILRAFSFGFEKVETSVISSNIAAIKVNEYLNGQREGLIKKHYWIEGKGYDIVRFGFFKSMPDTLPEPPPATEPDQTKSC